MFDPARPQDFVTVAEAAGPLERMRGLIGRTGLGPANGLLLRTKQIHTFGMFFVVDVIYLASDGHVLKVRTMKPGRVGPVVFSAKWILELEAGEAKRLGIGEGSRLVRDDAP